MNWSAIMTVVFTISLMVLQGCATPPRQAAVPMGLEDQAQVPGLSDVRYRIGLGKDMAAVAQEGVESYRREQEQLAASGRSGQQLPPAVFLAVSGGGDNGA